MVFILICLLRFTEQVKEVVTNVIQVMKEIIGVSTFFEFYNEARDLIISKRQTRKEARSFQAAVNPEKTIEQQKKKRQKRKLTKKRKLEEFAASKNRIKIPKVNE